MTITDPRMAKNLRLAKLLCDLPVADALGIEFWSDAAVDAISEKAENLLSEIEVATANSLTESSRAPDTAAEFSGLAEAYHAEDEAASRRPGAARRSSTLRSEIGYEPDPVGRRDWRRPEDGR